LPKPTLLPQITSPSLSLVTATNKPLTSQNDTNTSATQKNAWTNKCTPYFVFDETEFLIWAGNTPRKETLQQLHQQQCR
jgi:hypothetical protein